MTKKIPVFYRVDMAAANPGSYSPSASKPLEVYMDWMHHFDGDIHTHSFSSARHLLATAHCHHYVNDVLMGRINNGFENANQAVNESMSYTTGSMVAATLYALEHGIAVSPTSGFHHAGYSFGGGYCTFNGLVVAAIAANKAGAGRILILDMDGHWGNGTEDIIQRKGLDYITHISRGKYTNPEEAMEAAGMVGNCPRKTFDLVIYQAGADLHKNDPLMAGMLTTTGMRVRDRLVFEGCHLKGVPLVWNLAGGYQRDKAGTIEPVLALHRNTMAECIKVYA